MGQIANFDPLPTFTRSTLPDAKSDPLLRDVEIVIVENDGTRAQWISNGTAWVKAGGGGAANLVELGDIGTANLPALNPATGTALASANSTATSAAAAAANALSQVGVKLDTAAVASQAAAEAGTASSGYMTPQRTAQAIAAQAAPNAAQLVSDSDTWPFDKPGAGKYMTAKTVTSAITILEGHLD